MATEKLSDKESHEFLNILKKRIEKNRFQIKDLSWNAIENKLKKDSAKLLSLYKMEQTGGEPDVIKIESEIIFCDCSKESPSGRRSFCYDHQALDARKENKPKDSAVNAAEEMGIELLDEKQYRELQSLAQFDEKTSSWIKTPEDIRKLGSAFFCDRRFNFVFLYHNGVQSYYASRGFRGILRV